MNRKRKLTWIEKKQIEKMAFDHPFFDIPGSVLSKKEAEAIIRSAEARKSGVEIVSEACDKAGVPRPDFVDNHSSVFDNLKEVFAIPVIRRIGVIAIAVILLVIFFVATPIGRVIAESVIQYIVTLFEDGRLVVNQKDNEKVLFLTENDEYLGQDEQDEGNDTENIVPIGSFEDFTMTTGKTPITLMLSPTKLYYIIEPEIDYLALYSIYDTFDGKITACQIWDAESMVSSTLAGYLVYDADESIYYSIEEDGSIYCTRVMTDSVFTVTSKGNYTLDNLIEMIKG